VSTDRGPRANDAGNVDSRIGQATALPENSQLENSHTACVLHGDVEVSAVITITRGGTLVSDSTVRALATRLLGAGLELVSRKHACDSCGRPCYCLVYTPDDGCLTCGRADCNGELLHKTARGIMGA
jgi:hypothetical protein